MNENPLAPLGDLSKPANTLVEKISEAVGGIFRPFQIKRVAKAEAEAAIIQAETQIQISEIQRRAINRFIEEETRKQANMEEITRKALPLVNPTSNPENVDSDWITNFFDKCRIVSSDEMQSLWAKILSEEANSPGSFSRKTVNLLSDLDKNDAALFTTLCGYGLWIGAKLTPLIFDVQDEIYNRNGINFSSLSHLNTMGLIQFDNLSGFQYLNLPKPMLVHYFQNFFWISPPQGHLMTGKVLLTQAGIELSRICGSRPVDGFYEYIFDMFSKGGHNPQTSPPNFQGGIIGE